MSTRISSSNVTGRLLLPGAVSGLPTSSSSSSTNHLSTHAALEKTEWRAYHHAPHFLRDLHSQVTAHDGGLEPLEVVLPGSVTGLLQVWELWIVQSHQPFVWRVIQLRHIPRSGW